MTRAVVATEHHQCVRDLAPGFLPCAVADDGIIEAIENPDLPQVLAVQWHPERSSIPQIESLGRGSDRRCWAC